MTQKTLVTLLLCSAALNVFFLGIGAAHAWRHHSGPGPAHHDRRGSPDGPLAPPLGRFGAGPPGAGAPGASPAEGTLIRDMVWAIGGPKDPRVHELLQGSRAGRRTHRAQVERAQADLRRILATRPLDRARLEETLAELRAMTLETQKQAQKTLLRLASEMTDEERARLAPGGAPAPK